MGKKREEDETEGVDLFNRQAAKVSGCLPLRFFFLFLFCPVRYDAISLLCVIFQPVPKDSFLFPTPPPHKSIKNNGSWAPSTVRPKNKKKTIKREKLSLN